MIPSPGRTLSDLAMRLATRGIAEAKSEFGQVEAGLISGLLASLAEDFERAVANRMTEIDDMKALFAQANSLLALPTELIRQITDYASVQPASLHLADVNDAHGKGFETLIALHASIEEELEKQQAKSANNPHLSHLNLAIWRLLREHSERNKFNVASP